MNRDQIKSFLDDIKLFSESGKLNRNRLSLITDDVVSSIYQATSNCQSPELKDRIYWILHDIDDYKICKTCGSKIIKSIKSFASTFVNQEYCSVKCRMSCKDFHAKARKALLEKTGYDSPIKNPAIKKKIRETNLLRYGVDNAFKSEEIKNKIKKTSLDRYGVNSPNQASNVKEKRKQTCIERYGVDNPSKLSTVKEKRKQTCIERYGVENANQVEIFKEKLRSTNLMKYGSEYPSHTERSIQTCIERYGVRNPMQHPPIFEKAMRNRFKTKNYVTDSGKIIPFQGYEDVVIKFLLEEVKIHEDQIVTDKTDVPKIFYHNPVKNDTSRYYADIWIQDLNLLIEVKSEFTINHHYNITLAKQDECKRQGYNHLIIICSKKKILRIL